MDGNAKCVILIPPKVKSKLGCDAFRVGLKLIAGKRGRNEYSRKQVM